MQAIKVHSSGEEFYSKIEPESCKLQLVTVYPIASFSTTKIVQLYHEAMLEEN